MHPDDVARHVDASVDALRDAVATQPDLPIIGLELNGMQLHVRYEVELLASAPAAAGPGVLVGNQIVGTVFNVPILGSRRREQFILALDLTDFDSQAPTAEVLSVDGTALPRERWPRDTEGQGIVPDHPLWRHRPFFCRPGTREFHSHPQHEDEPWDSYREGLSLSNIVLSLIRDLATRWTMQ
jgi:hypothetical protein